MISLNEYNILNQKYQIPKITLDFYKDSFNCISSKQLDHARYLEITLSENGIIRNILSDEKARMRLLKPDNTYVFTDCDAIENGKILAKLDDNILAACGKARFDILITNLSSSEAENDLVYSTKLGYIDISPTPYSNDAIESTDDFSALNNLLVKEGQQIELLNQLNQTINESEELRKSNELLRQQNEEKRQSDTSAAVNHANMAAQEALNAADTTTSNANEAIANAQAAADNANTAASNTNAAISNANNAMQDANAAADRANAAAEICEDMIVGSGIILSSEKGAANGVATLDENGFITEGQVPYITDAEIASLNEYMDGLLL